MESETIQFETCGSVSVVTLNRPKTLNSLFEQLRLDFIAGLRKLRRERKTRALVITGKGGAFCAGADLKEGIVSSPSGLDIEQVLNEQYNIIIRELRDAPFPVVAAVDGVAAGAGCSIALASDFILATKRAKFIQIFSRIGLVPDLGSSFFLPRVVGRQRALGMMLTNDPLSAEQAFEWGIVWKILEQDNFFNNVTEFAEKLAHGPTRAFITARKLVDDGATNSLDAQMTLEALAQGIMATTEDATGACAAFLEKRQPIFKGN
ncbi:MAG: enoyl-CoA hydratase-related protein [Pseudomonadota bacterium]